MASPTIIFPNASLDAVAVFNSAFQQVFANARPLRARVRPTSKLMDHTVEIGQINSDYKITNPIEIELPVVVSSLYYRDVYSQIIQLYNDSELLTVQTRASNYPNMVIAAPPHEEDPDKYDVITINLQLREIQLVTSDTNYAPASPPDQNTQSLGEQAPGTIRGVQTSQGVQDIPLSQQPAATSPSSNYTISGVQTLNGTSEITGDQALTIQQSMRN